MDEISGIQFSYSFLCLRKLWFFSNQIVMEQNSDNVALGNLIDENTFNNKKKHIMIDNRINIDFLDDGIIYEIKKSLAEKEMAIWQIKYYLYTLMKKGIEKPVGILKIPNSKYQETVELEEMDIIKIENQLKLIKTTVANNKCPSAQRIKACSKCSYFELCFI